MSNNEKLINLGNLTKYDELIKVYISQQVAEDGVQYLGIVDNREELDAIVDMGQGDYVRVGTAFENAHAGDLFIYDTDTWVLIHCHNDSNTTYELTKSGNTITLIDSNNQKTSVTDSDTTYTADPESAITLAGTTFGTDLIKKGSGETSLVLLSEDGTEVIAIQSDGTATVTQDPSADMGIATKNYVDANKVQIVTTEGTGSAYIATVPGITSLTTGVSFVMVPHTTSTSASPTLNVNGLGTKNIKRIGYSSSDTYTYNGVVTSWLAQNKPLRVMYNGAYWIVEDMPKPTASDLSGIVSVSKGGTGKSTLTSNAILAGNGTSAVNMIATAAGALYATTGNGAAQFGTLPIAQGGTGATSDAQIVANLKSALVDLIYPIGSVYMSFESTNPETLFGGTWEQLPDRFLLGAGSLGSGAQGGNSYLSLAAAVGAYNSDTSAIGYAATGPIPGATYTYGGNVNNQVANITSINHSTRVYDFVQQTYDPSLYPPYVTVYMWKRVSHVGHATWTNGDIVVTPSLSASGRNLTATYTTSINNSSYITTNNLRTTYTWYYQGNTMWDDTSSSIYMDNIGTYKVEVTVSGTLIDNEGCSSYVSKTGTASYTFNG